MHNHPSGDPTPSCGDIQKSQQMIAMAVAAWKRVATAVLAGLQLVDAVFQRYRPAPSIDPELMKGALPMQASFNQAEE